MAAHERDTIYVVGAGASYEVGLPLGVELKSLIADAVDFSRPSVLHSPVGLALRSVAKSAPEERDFLHSASLVKQALPLAISIDNLIHAHSTNRGVELCGKLGIANTILDRERSSALFPERVRGRDKVIVSKAQKTWLHRFFQILTENCQATDIGARFERVALVVFNYDRCIEQYLFHALQDYYGVSPHEASAMMASLKIFRPYGKIGDLPWQSQEGAVPFGEEPDAQSLIEVAERLKTFTEGTNKQDADYLEMTRSVLRARRLIFFGFAFHHLNMDLLVPKKRTHQLATSRQKIYGTAIKMSESDVEEIVSVLAANFGIPESDIALRNQLRCVDLVEEYSRALSMVR